MLISIKYSGWSQQKNLSMKMGNLIHCNLDTNPGRYSFSFSACKELKQYALKRPQLQAHLLLLPVLALYSGTVTGVEDSEGKKKKQYYSHLKNVRINVVPLGNHLSDTMEKSPGGMSSCTICLHTQCKGPWASNGIKSTYRVAQAIHILKRSFLAMNMSQISWCCSAQRVKLTLCQILQQMFFIYLCNSEIYNFMINSKKNQPKPTNKTLISEILLNIT